MRRISRDTKVVIAGALLCWVLTAVDGVLYVTNADSDNADFLMLAFFWCLGMSTWTTYNAGRMIAMDREGL